MVAEESSEELEVGETGREGIRVDEMEEWISIPALPRTYTVMFYVILNTRKLCEIMRVKAIPRMRTAILRVGIAKNALHFH